MLMKIKQNLTNVFYDGFVKFRVIFCIVIGLLVLGALSGCHPFTYLEQPQIISSIELSASQSIGQTFVARFDGLQAVQIHLTPGKTGDGIIRFSLYSEPGADQALRTVSLPLVEVKSAQFYRFDFPSIVDARRQYYYVLLEIDGEGSVFISTAGPDSYLNGALYLQNTPGEGQMTFHLVHDDKQLLQDLFHEVTNWIKVLIIAIYLYVVPGWVIFQFLWPEWKTLPLTVKIVLAAGVSLSLYPLVMLWCDVFGIHLGVLHCWIPSLLLGILLLKNRFYIDRILTHGSALQSIKRSFMISFPDWVLLILLGLIVFTRFWSIRDLEAPMWGDAYHHTVISQLIIDQGGLFGSWEPYASMQSFTYHFGFHTAVAIFSWITNIAAYKSVLWVGQVMNILAVLAIYPLAYQIGRDKWAGIIGVLIAGLASPMPNFYLNWGRYTQLTGQIIFCAALFFFLRKLEKQQGITKFWCFLIIGCLLATGLALTHYRIFIFLVISLFSIGLHRILKGDNHVKTIKEYVSLGVGTSMLFFPWLLNVYGGKFMENLTNQITTLPSQATSFTWEYNAIGNVSIYLPAALWALLALSLGWGLWKNEINVYIVGLSWFLIICVANPNWFGLPGSGMLSNFAVFIAIYIPAAVMIGGAASWLWKTIKDWIANLPVKYFRHVYMTVVIIIITAFALIAFTTSRSRIEDIQPISYGLVTRPDIRAMAWIRDNVSDQAYFLVNSFLAYGDSISVGSDSGWWLEYFTNRHSTLPPIIYASEKEPYSGFRQQVHDITVASTQLEINQLWQFLKDRNITHVYIGQRFGRVNYIGAVLEPTKMLSHPGFQLIYHQDRVWIFEIIR